MKVFHSKRALLHLGITVLLTVFSLAGLKTQAQNLKAVAQEVTDAKAAGTEFENFRLFTTAASSARLNYSSAVDDGLVFDLDASLVTALRQADPQQMRLELPFQDEDGKIELELIRAEAFKEGIKVKLDGMIDVTDQLDLGIHYKGIISGNTNSVVAISIFEDEVSGLISRSGANYTLGKLSDSESGHIIYDSRDLRMTPDFNCDTQDPPVMETPDQPGISTQRQDHGECIGVYVESDVSIYNDQGSSVSSTTNFLIGIFFQSIILYANDGFILYISSINVRTATATPNAYNNGTTRAQLDAFAANTGAYTGDIGHMVDLQNLGGLAEEIGALCLSDSDDRLCYSAINSTDYENVPTYTFPVYIIAHEMGHLVGSRHTHGCYWNGNNTQIDDCGNQNPITPGSPEGAGCYDSNNPIIPSSGTIMSYCQSTMDFTAGFGTQPRQSIIDHISGATCLSCSPLNCNGSSHTVNYSGSYQDFQIPNDPALNFIDFTVNGGDGGRAGVNACSEAGGEGATATARFSVGDGANDLEPGGTIRFIVGGGGASDGSSVIGTGTGYGGGGGGSGVMYLKPGTGNWQLLAIAGGGGGAYVGQFAGICTDDEGGQGGRSGTSGGNGNGDIAPGNGGSGGNGGEDGGSGGAEIAGGGGGYNTAGDGITCIDILGGFEIFTGGAGGAGFPVGGGTVQCFTGFPWAIGGYGCGGGGAGFGSGGGGGGYSGGGGGGTTGHGGGGGSYLASWRVSGSVSAGSTGGGSQSNGFIQYQCILNTPPVAQCKNVTVDLNSGGSATITAAQVDNGSYDPDGDAITLAVSPNSFNCGNLGGNTVTLTVTDPYAASDQCTATVTIRDVTPPNAFCKNVTVQLNAIGQGSTTASDVDNGSSDACSIVSRSVSPNSFNCDDLGNNTVTLTVTDGSGNSSTCSANALVVDNIAPTALCKDITVELDAVFGTATIAPTDVDNGSFDNCFIVSYDLATSDVLNGGIYDCDDLGDNPEILIVTDQSGNTDQCDATVTVVDVTPPTPICQDIIRYLDFGACTVSITPLEIDNGSFDNCYIVDYALDVDFFDTDDVGDNTVELTVTDQSDNSASCSATVTILRRPTYIENLGAFEGQYSDYPEISAQLFDALTGQPLAGKNIEFELSPGTTGAGVVYESPAGAIPDAGTLCDAINISGADGAVTGFEVAIDVSHTWVGDLDVTLTSPDGTTISLMDRPGRTQSGFGCSDDNISFLLFYRGAFNGADDVEEYCGVNPLLWNDGLGEAHVIDGFDAFNGESANGDWTLCINDNAGGDIGVLNEWAIAVIWSSTGRTSRTEFTRDLKAERDQEIDLMAFATNSEAEKRAANERLVDGIDEAPATPTTIYLTATTDANGIATISPRLGHPQPPTILGYEYIITSIFPDDDPCYEGSRDDDLFTVLQEDARVTYTGKNFASTVSGSSGNAVVVLAATVCDITNTPDAAGDTDPGDISNATVTFVDRDNGDAPISPPLEVVHLPGDSTKGTVSFVWVTDIGLADCETYNIGIVVDNYYTRDDPADDQVIEICHPDNHFITGGGYIILENSWGALPGDPGTNCNFGVHGNFMGRNDQVGGHVNVIYRRIEADGEHEIQISSIKVASVGIDEAEEAAEICGSGMITDVTTGEILYPAGTFIIRADDNGNPGRLNDLIRFAFYAPDGELIFSSNWNVTYTDMSLLQGGNIVFHTQGGPNQRDLDEDVRLIDAEVYPNPFRNNVKFSFTLEETGRTFVEIISVSGESVFIEDLGELESAVRQHHTFHAPDAMQSGTYLYRITSGRQVAGGTIMFVK